jgi:secretion system chaperone SscA
MMDTSHFEEEMLDVMKDVKQDVDLLKIFTPAKVKELYTVAYQLYRDQHYTDASYFFRFLLLSNPKESKYWKGLGACLQMTSEYQQALNCYICCQLLDKDQPDPYMYLHAADCYFALGQIEHGLKALDAAHLGAQEKMDTQVMNHVILMKEMWSKDKK